MGANYKAAKARARAGKTTYGGSRKTSYSRKSSSKSSSSGSSASSKADALRQLAAITDTSEGLQKQTAVETIKDKQKSSRSSSSKSSSTPTQSQIAAADTGSVSMIDPTTGQPVSALKDDAAASLIAKQASGQPLTQQELIQAEVGFAQRVGTVGGLSSRGVSTARDIAIARVTTQAMAQGAVNKQEAITKSYVNATKDLQKKYNPAEVANILTGKKEISEKEAAPFYKINTDYESTLLISAPAVYLQGQRARITEQKIKGIESQVKNIQKGGYTPAQEIQLEQGLKSSVKEFGIFTGQKVEQKQGFWAKGFKNIKESTRAANVLIAGRQGIKTPKFVSKAVSTYENQASRDIARYQRQLDTLLQKQLTLLPNSTKYKANEKELQNIQKKIEKEQSFQWRREGSRDFIKYKPFSAGLAVTAGFAIGTVGGAVGSVATTGAKLGLLGVGTFFTGKYLTDIAAQTANIKDKSQRQKFLGEKVTEFGLFSFGAGAGAKVATTALKTKIKPLGEGETSTKFVGEKDKFLQTSKGEVKFSIKQPFKKPKTGKVETAFVEKGIKFNKIFKTKGEVVGETTISGKPLKFKFTTKGITGTDKISKGIRQTSGTKGTYAETFRTRGVKPGKTSTLAETQKVITKGVKTKFKPTSRSFIKQKEIYSIKEGGRTIAEYKSQTITATKGLGKTTTIKTKALRGKTEIPQVQKVSLKQGLTKLIASKKGFSQKLVSTERIIETPKVGGSKIGVQPTIQGTTVISALSSRINPLRIISPFSPININSNINTPSLISSSRIDYGTLNIPKISTVSVTSSTTDYEKLTKTTPYIDTSVKITQDVGSSPSYQPSYIQPTIPTFGVPAQPSPVQPPVIIPTILPFLPVGRSGKISSVSQTRLKQLKGFTPSARAAVFNIKGTTSSAAITSGLGERLIAEKPKKKKKTAKRK